MAPAVYRQNCVIHVQLGDLGPDFTIKEGAVKGEILVVHPGTEDIVEKKLLVQFRAPGHAFPQKQGVIDKL